MASTHRARYVYVWLLGETPMYVGSGHGYRAWRGFDSTYRALVSFPGFSIKILVLVDTDKEARRIERWLIQKWQPAWNIVGKLRKDDTLKPTPPHCPQWVVENGARARPGITNQGEPT